MRKLLMLGVVSMTITGAALADEVMVVGEIRDIGVTDILVDTSMGNQRVEIGPRNEFYRHGVTLKMRDYVKIHGHTMPDSDVIVADRLWVRGTTVRNLTHPKMHGPGDDSMSGRASVNAAMTEDIYVTGEIRDIGVTDILVDTSTGNQRVEVGPMTELYSQGVTLKMRDEVKIKGHAMSGSDVIVADRLWVRGTTIRNLTHPKMHRAGEDSMSGRTGINAAMTDDVYVIGEIRDIGVTDILVDTSTGNKRVEVGSMTEFYKRGVTLKMRDYVKIKGHAMSGSDVIVADRLWVRGTTIRDIMHHKMHNGEGGGR